MFNKINQDAINDYENYLIKMGFDINKIYNNIKTINDINKYENLARYNLGKLENLSIEYKLYDSNYKELTIAMGKFYIGINKCSKLGISLDNTEKFINNFLDFNIRFEELVQTNLIKDAYVWK